MKIILMVSITIDGRIAESEDELVNWTSKEDKKLFARITKEAGVVILGEKTYKTIGKPLAGRLNVILTEGDWIREEEGKLEPFKGNVKNLIKNLEKRGYKKCVVGGGNEVYRQFLKSDLVDEMLITYVPIIFGKGMSFVSGLDYKNLNRKKFNLRSVRKLNSGEIFAKYIK